MNKTCGTCDAFSALANDAEVNGLCRARPPTPVLVGNMFQSVFPFMAPFGWCREHRDRVVMNKMDPVQLGNLPVEGSA